MAADNSVLEVASQIRFKSIAWETFASALPKEKPDFDVVAELARSKDRSQLWDKDGAKYAGATARLLSSINKNDVLSFIVTLIIDALEEKPARASIFVACSQEKGVSVSENLVRLLRHSTDDLYLLHQASRVASRLLVANDPCTDSDARFYITWLHSVARQGVPDTQELALAALQKILRVDRFRFLFMQDAEASKSLQAVISSEQTSFQSQYQALFCYWVLTFSPEVCTRFQEFGLGLLSDLVAALVSARKEKVARMCLGVFRNVLDKGEDSQVKLRLAVALISFKLIPAVALIVKENKYDEEAMEDAKFLDAELNKYCEHMSSYDEYLSEVSTGRLEWSPVHKSERFWRENVSKFNENNHQILKYLVRIIETSPDPKIVAVAIHDCGEYVRHYPAGKSNLDKLKGKILILERTQHENAEVRYHALLALQKLMTTNWEYLQKQVAKK